MKREAVMRGKRNPFEMTGESQKSAELTTNKAEGLERNHVFESFKERSSSRCREVALLYGLAEAASQAPLLPSVLFTTPPPPSRSHFHFSIIRPTPAHNSPARTWPRSLRRPNISKWCATEGGTGPRGGPSNGDGDAQR